MWFTKGLKNNILDENKEVTLQDLEKRLKRMERSTHIQTAIILLGFLGIVTLTSVLNKGSKVINGK